MSKRPNQLQLEIDMFMATHRPAPQAVLEREAELESRTMAELEREPAPRGASHIVALRAQGDAMPDAGPGGLTQHGKTSPEARALAKKLEATGDKAGIDRLEGRIIAYLGDYQPQNWLRGSTRWLVRQDRKAGAKTTAYLAPVAPSAERVEAYEAKREAKQERLEKAAARASSASSAAYAGAKARGDMIPFGQPILVGHHSERRHRSDIAKIDRGMRKSFELADKAKDLASRAAAIESGSGGISSDDPAAVVKLRTELAPLVELQARMKAANAAIKKHSKEGAPAQIAALVMLGHPPARAAKLLEKDFAGRIGFPDYAITNNGANIRRIEKRIVELMQKESTPARATVTGALPDGMTFEIVENKDANRVQITFGGKPSEAIRAKLKAQGFRWAPSEGAWQRQASNGAWYHATHICGAA